MITHNIHFQGEIKNWYVATPVYLELWPTVKIWTNIMKIFIVFSVKPWDCRMGSGSSKQPQVTQSAPVTARSTPSGPRRNKQFEEVQITQAGSSQSRAKPSRSQGTTPNPHQSTSSQARTPRDRDIGASGHISSRQGGQRGKVIHRSNSMFVP